MTKTTIYTSLLLCGSSIFANEQVNTPAKQEIAKDVDHMEMKGSFVKKEFGTLFVSVNGEEFMTFKNSAEKIKNYMNSKVKIKAQAQAGEYRKQLVYIDKIEEVK